MFTGKILIFYRFTINLHNSAADFSGNDVPLHLSVRFDEGKVSGTLVILY